MGGINEARSEDVKVVRDLAADWRGTLPGPGNPNFVYGVVMLADVMRAMCRQMAQEARQLGNHGDALGWEVRAAFFNAAADN
jgi:hypothetical protein